MRDTCSRVWSLSAIVSLRKRGERKNKKMNEEEEASFVLYIAMCVRCMLASCAGPLENKTDVWRERQPVLCARHGGFEEEVFVQKEERDGRSRRDNNNGYFYCAAGVALKNKLTFIRKRVQMVCTESDGFG